LHSHYPRLSLADRSFLRVETAGGMDHIAALCVLDGRPLVDAEGNLDLAAIRRRVELRLARVPELRRMVHRPPPFGGPLLWVDDPDFSIDRHVRVTAVAPPGDEAALLEAAVRIASPLIDHSHPLWEIWLLTGLADSRVGMVFKIHHAVADGLAVVAMIVSMFDLEPNAPDPALTEWSPQPAPRRSQLVKDNLGCRLSACGSVIAHPLVGWHNVTTLVTEVRRLSRLRTAAPRSSVNARVGMSRCARVVHIDLEMSRTVAHMHGAKVNDVFLSIVTGGLRDLLIGRGERVDGTELVAGVPATLRSAQAARGMGNASGGLMVRLPVGVSGAERRLELIAAATRTAKSEQRAASIQAMMDWLGAAGLTQRYAATQRMVNVMATNVPGPPMPLYFLGSKIEDVMPMIGTSGNVTLVFAALSYGGRLNMVVNADAKACPDIDVLITGMERTWAEYADVTASRNVPGLSA